MGRLPCWQPPWQPPLDLWTRRRKEMGRSPWQLPWQRPPPWTYGQGGGRRWGGRFDDPSRIGQGGGRRWGGRFIDLSWDYGCFRQRGRNGRPIYFMHGPPLSSLAHPHRMTAIEPNTVLGIDGDTWEFELDFNGNVGGSSTANLVSDSDTITSAASEVTLRPGRGPGFEQGARDKKLNPGPPYASGDIISCNSCSPLATHGLQRAYMLSADHPNYCLQLEEGVTIDTHTGETWMTPRYIPGVFAPDQDDPFKEALKRGDVKVGSYGMHIDAQLDALQKIREEAKEFAKAIKADNAAVPKRLWDDRMRSGGSGQDTRDKVFALLCRAMHQRLLRLLRLDCCRYTKETHGRRRGHWSKALRLTKEGRPTEVKLDRRAITNVLWHNVHTNWFEFNAGSRLVHFCFPKMYRTMACDGVPVWFGRPGPNTRDALRRLSPIPTYAPRPRRRSPRSFGEGIWSQQGSKLSPSSSTLPFQRARMTCRWFTTLRQTS